jgi:hypothetical protein
MREGGRDKLDPVTLVPNGAYLLSFRDSSLTKSGHTWVPPSRDPTDRCRTADTAVVYVTEAVVETIVQALA